MAQDTVRNPMISRSEQAKAVAESLYRARSALFVTGAGISADSGLPTYRGVGGLYDDRETEDDVPIEVALSGPMLAQKPDLTWKYIAQIERACRGARFNRGHELITQLVASMERHCILTQNVDGFHRDVGSSNVIEIHGTLRKLHCVRCRWHESIEDYSRLVIPPRCPDCDDLVRPGIVLFGEMLPPDAVHQLGRELEQGFDVVFSIGTSSLFPYIVQPVVDSHARGSTTIEINPEPTSVSSLVNYRFDCPATPALEMIFDALRTLRN